MHISNTNFFLMLLFIKYFKYNKYLEMKLALYMSLQKNKHEEASIIQWKKYKTLVSHFAILSRGKQLKLFEDKQKISPQIVGVDRVFCLFVLF